MDYVEINPNVVIPQPYNDDAGLPMMLSDTAVVRDMLARAPGDTSSEKSALSDRITKRKTLKRKISNQNVRKTLKSKKVKGNDVYSPSESPMGSNTVNNQMPCTPASSSSPGESMSDRKIVGSSVDNVYEFTEQEDGQKLPDESLLKRKRSTRNYGKPKNRWLLEAEMKSISESRQKSYNDTSQTENLNDANHKLTSFYPPSSAEKSVSNNKPILTSDTISHNLKSTGVLQCPKIRINRNPSKNGIYECHIIERTQSNESLSGSSNLSSYRTECGDIFCVGDVVWAKLVGWPWWPAKLQSFYGDVEGHHTGTAQVRWFNWDQISFVKCEKLYHFLAAYNSKLDKRRKAGAYKAAVDQALKEAMLIKNRQTAQNTNLYDDDDDDCNDGDDESNYSDDPDYVPTRSIRKVKSNSLLDTASVNASQLKTLSYANPPSSNPCHDDESVATHVSPVSYNEDEIPSNPVDSNQTNELNKVAESELTLSSETRTSKIIPEDFHNVSAHYDFFDPSSSVPVDVLSAFEESSVRNGEMVNLGPLVDIGPNLNLLNPKSMYSCIPSFSDDDELDMRPVLDPASIENV